MKGFALGLALKQRRKATRKSPIVAGKISNIWDIVTNFKTALNYKCRSLRTNKAVVSSLWLVWGVGVGDYTWTSYDGRYNNVSFAKTHLYVNSTIV